MSTIKKFTSFTTSNCYVVVPNDKEGVCFVVDLPPDVEPALEYIKSFTSENCSIELSLTDEKEFAIANVIIFTYLSKFNYCPCFCYIQLPSLLHTRCTRAHISG